MPTGHVASAGRMAAAASIEISPSVSIAPQSGGVCRHTSAHLVGHRAKYLQRFNAVRHQRGDPAQGGLFGGEPTILRVQRATVEGTRGGACREGPATASSSMASLRLKPCAQFAVVGVPALRSRVCALGLATGELGSSHHRTQRHRTPPAASPAFHTLHSASFALFLGSPARRLASLGRRSSENVMT